MLDSENEELRNIVLEVIPKTSATIAEVQQKVNSSLQKYFLTRMILKEETVTVSAFADIKKNILEELNKAINTIKCFS